MKHSPKKGFVLLELLLATAIAAFAVCGILLVYIVGMDLIKTSKNASIATSAAQGVLEEIRNTPFTNIPGMIFVVNGIGEDLNLNGALDAGEDTNGNGIIDSTVELVTQVANR